MRTKIPETPFDDSALARIKRMGLLLESGDPDLAAVGAMARVYAALYFDALCDRCQEEKQVRVICEEMIGQRDPDRYKQLFLSICAHHDYIHLGLPEPIWRIAGTEAVVKPFSLEFVRCLERFLAKE